MANFCENCGSPLKADNRFCPNCGAPVNEYDASNPVSSAATAAAATIGAVDSEPTTEKSQGAFVPPRQDMQQNCYEKTGLKNKSAAPRPAPGARRENPHVNYKRPEESVRGESGPKYEPDNDLQSMFLRYDNRLNRKRYILRSLALWAATMAVTLVIGFVATTTGIEALFAMSTIISVASAIPGFMLMIRRLHDLNRPAWWSVGAIIPPVTFVLVIYLAFFKGTNGHNQYGPDPLEAQG